MYQCIPTIDLSLVDNGKHDSALDWTETGLYLHTPLSLRHEVYFWQCIHVAIGSQCQDLSSCCLFLCESKHTYTDFGWHCNSRQQSQISWHSQTLRLLLCICKQGESSQVKYFFFIAILLYTVACIQIYMLIHHSVRWVQSLYQAFSCKTLHR